MSLVFDILHQVTGAKTGLYLLLDVDSSQREAKKLT